jgi:hypothetical protein
MLLADRAQPGGRDDRYPGTAGTAPGGDRVRRARRIVPRRAAAADQPRLRHSSRVREAYGDQIYRRLAEVKAKYDPYNAFDHNKSIRPADARERTKGG